MGLLARLGTLLCLVLAMSVLAGCGGNDTLPGATGPAEEPATTAPPDNTWPVFPPVTGDVSPYRLVSEDTVLVQGSDYAQAHGDSNYALPATEDYVIVSGSEDKLAWAIYTIDELETDRPVELEITVAPAPAEPGGTEDLPLSCWIGISDYTNYTWEWSGPYEDTGSIILNSEEIRDRYVTNDFTMSFAVLTVTASTFASASNPDGLTAALIDVAETTTLAATDEDYYSTRPFYAAIEEVTLGAKTPSALDPDTQYVHLDWVHYYDSANDENEALQYKVYRQGPGDPARVPIGSVNAPETTYCDPDDNATGVDEPLPGVTYTYYLRAYNPAGYTPYDAAPVTIPDDPVVPDVIIITAYTIRIENAASGIGFDPELFDSTESSGTAVANEVTNLGLEWIEGTFNGEPFAGNASASWPEDMTQADYDTAFNGARDNLVWSLTNFGAEDHRYTSHWVLLDSGLNNVVGDPGTGRFFPDYDPESTGDRPEGKLNVNLRTSDTTAYPSTPELEVEVPVAVSFNVFVDIESDPAAALILGIEDELGDPIEEFFILDTEIHAYLPLSWGVGGEPADLSELDLELQGFFEETGASTGADVEFSYTTGTPAVGEFAIDTSGDPVIHCVFSGLSMMSWYETFRVRVADAWSTINLPETLVTVVVPSQPEFDTVAVPQVCWPDVDHLQIFIDDPVVRRNPLVQYNFLTETIEPLDPEAYNDTLKTNGDEFFLYVSSSFFPKAAVMETDNPDLITSLEDGDPAVFAFNQCPHRICVDISALTLPGQPGDPVKTYSYKLFNQDGTTQGQGTFTVEPTDNLLAAPIGINWGIDVWDREELELNSRTYDDFTLDGTTVGTATPDVLWFELTGGWFFDYEQDEDAVFPTTDSSGNANVKIRFEDTDSGNYMYADCSLRIVGLGTGQAYIALFVPTNLAFHNPGVTGWPGVFEIGHTYDVQLEDVHYAGIEYTFSQPLLVVGTNPNT